MSLSGLHQASLRIPGLDELAEKGISNGLLLNCIKPVQPFAIAAIANPDQTLVVVTATTRDAEDLISVLSSIRPDLRTEIFPSWETLPHEKLSPSRDVVGRRLALIHQLKIDPEQFAVIAVPLRSLLQPFAANLGEHPPVEISGGLEISINMLVTNLIGLGYERVDLVERRGQVAVRGGIVDVFSPVDDHPIRIEFFGDCVEELRKFNVADQRSIKDIVTELVAPPCRELLITNEVRLKAQELIATQPLLAQSLQAIADGRMVEGMESLAPLLTGKMQSIVELLPKKSSIVLIEPERIRSRAEDLIATSEEFLKASWSVAATGGDTPLDLGLSSFRSLGDIYAQANSKEFAWWSISALTNDQELVENKVIKVEADLVPGYRSKLEDLTKDLHKYLEANVLTAVVATGAGSAKRYQEALTELELDVNYQDNLTELKKSKVNISSGNLFDGFSSDFLVVITETEISGNQTGIRDQTRMPSRRRRQIDPMSLKNGDFVVHEQHGIGQFIELVQRNIGGSSREYLIIEYASSRRGHPGDRLFVPTDQLDQITKYVGGETPTLSKMGGADWGKAKGRARKAVKEIAGELIRLYAARQSAPGFAFSGDTQWQRELEDAFPYSETPDQLATIEEVKADMERPIPMDRVVCGDVGFGKTEIALRAAFKATQDGKQVAVLAPTTLLVQQHLQTFTHRFAPFPIKVSALSRFQSDSEIKKTIAELKSGVVDVVIGTHRLLGAEIEFKDLGLVVVDEEQRFGVEHKEHLKTLRANVDVLSMSATPIPRTLEMSITGIRDMSVMQTPPEQRLPILTFVGPYEKGQVAAAIKRELIRDGQVFFVHNRVDSIDRTASELQDLLPNARIAVAHGQMSEAALEQAVIDFWERRIDVLVSTTIVESGLDIANANTLIVDRAENLGLSQMHQLRGRVGRGRERGYAYFFHTPEKSLSDNAHDRLVTIAQHNSLGAGMAVALKDLEIRGAGNLLGGEQSGHIADVGFDLYVRMVGEALNEYRGIADDQPKEMRVELPVIAHIPHDWISEERLRLEAYRRISLSANAEALDDVLEELLDRYGTLPLPVSALFEVAKLRIFARSHQIEEIVHQGKMVKFGPIQLAESMQIRLSRLHPGSIVKSSTRTILIPVPAPEVDLLSWATQVITEVIATPILKAGEKS